MHYGYLDVEVTGGSNGVVTTVHGACYESNPNQAITAGVCEKKVEPVPVGGLVPLSLGVLVMGAAALRRRREAQA